MQPPIDVPLRRQAASFRELIVWVEYEDLQNQVRFLYRETRRDGHRKREDHHRPFAEFIGAVIYPRAFNATLCDRASIECLITRVS